MKEMTSVEQPPHGSESVSPAEMAPRPTRHNPVALDQIVALSGATMAGAAVNHKVSGVSLDSRTIVAGDLYIALPGAHTHGARFAHAAVAAGAVAVLTDDAGAQLLAGSFPVPVLSCENPRVVTGAVASLVYGTARITMPLFAVTGTNGKTTTTYFLNSLMQAMGKTTGLIGTIEILAGDEPIPSKLTTPESTDVHALLALMAERGLAAASMEVSSHALAFGRVDSVLFDIAGFTNLTQDHLDLHGGMQGYYATKAQLFTPQRAKRAVVTVDDEWGRKLAAEATTPTVTLSTRPSPTPPEEPGIEPIAAVHWQVAGIQRAGIGSRFDLHGPQGALLRVHTGLPGDFNVSNAALATVMVAEQAFLTADRHEVLASLQQILDTHDPFTVDVPGRMQLVGTAPVSIVDFAHNPDALARALAAVRSEEPGSKVIVVFGATGDRDATKRPVMGAIAAQGADVIIVTDDDPHNEDPAAIRADVLAGAVEANERGGLGRVIEEFDLRANAIVRAVELAWHTDTILVAGRGHEVYQEVMGVNVALDDREELRSALKRFGFPVASASRIES
ncbi:UDP-N-acetylmuramoylalanyl-D-glutamate--2,6-diaminopimelate ligase [Arthrobacter alpinus]|uniref:UDP-N-acetylmuramyl-tripeptide synthetase n=2 Tax=Arthrobacter TaxID=1663 RepID=A0A0M4RND6_9MICC|nr:UDP-N-acetylmuramoylalanyl-D-glutamate--2,6-diaminopimelate ligase [Arthrobacter alpinus]